MRECQKLANEKWRLKNPEKHREYGRNYYNRNKEAILSKRRNAEPSEATLERNRNYSRNYRLRNPDKKIKIDRDYYLRKTSKHKPMKEAIQLCIDFNYSKPEKIKKPKLFEILDVLRKDNKHYLWNFKSVLSWTEKDWTEFNKLKSA